jgi:hypothetical protein
MKAFDVPGFSVAVKDGKSSRSMPSACAHAKPSLPATPSAIASATKPFTAMGLCILVDQGKVDLDAPVKNTCPRAIAVRLTRRITVRLLCHRWHFLRTDRSARLPVRSPMTCISHLENKRRTSGIQQHPLHSPADVACGGQKWRTFCAIIFPLA